MTAGLGGRTEARRSAGTLGGYKDNLRDADAAKMLLAEGEGDEQPLFLLPAVLEKLPADDVLPNTSVEAGVEKALNN